MKQDKETDGRDDQTYVMIMDYYKNYARKSMPGKKANRYLHAAWKLRREGDVSNEAVLAGCYI